MNFRRKPLTHWLFGVVAALTLASGPLHADPAAFPLTWPVPTGAHHETIPFPLDFAPQVSYHGLEELRFAPGFSHPNAADYFTYSFVWWLDGSPMPGPGDYRSVLVSYFSGLMDDVAQEEHRRPGRFTTTARVVPGPHSFTATVWTWDAFFTDAALTLHIRMHERVSPVPGHRLFYFEVSPHPEDPVVGKFWTTVRQSLAGSEVHD